MHWWPKYGRDMDTFRAEVKLLLNAEEPEKPEEPETLYRVQVGAFHSHDNAERYAAQVKKAGFEDAFIAKVSDSLYRVQIGAFAVKANAERCRDKAEEAGFPGFVTKRSGEPQ
jgi:cell division protein FtsN